jgi:hypothetical protein
MHPALVVAKFELCLSLPFVLQKLRLKEADGMGEAQWDLQ